MSLWISCLRLRRCYSLDPVPLKLYVHIQWTRDLMRQIGWIDGNTVITIAIDGTNAFKALMYWWKLVSTMHREKHLFSTYSVTGKVARRVLSDWKCYTVRVQWREMCGVLSGWRCTIHDEWLVFCRSCSASGSVVQRLLSGWKCAVHVELLDMYGACSVTGKVARCVFIDWKFTARAEWLEIYRACAVTANILRCIPSGWKCTVHDEWLEIYIAL
jgi:hypothetical protein